MAKKKNKHLHKKPKSQQSTKAVLRKLRHSMVHGHEPEFGAALGNNIADFQEAFTPEQGDLANMLMFQHGQVIARNVHAQFIGCVRDNFAGKIFGFLSSLTIHTYVSRPEHHEALQALSLVDTVAVVAAGEDDPVFKTFALLLGSALQIAEDTFFVAPSEEKYPQ